MRYLFILILLCFTTIAWAQPTASFSLSKRKICSGTNLVFTNTSTGATSYNWYINDIFHSGNIHDSAIMIEPCYELQTIKLIAFNTSGSDTLTKVVEVFDTCALHLHGDYTNCVGDTIRKKAHPDAVLSTWSISPAHTLIEGCLSCDSIAFVLTVLGTSIELSSTYEGGCTQPVSYHYMSCNPLVGTGVNTINEERINIFPNPVKDIFTIEHKSTEKISTIQLYNMQGSCIAIQKHSASGIDMSQLPSGVYFLRVALTDGTIVKKILKE